MAPVPGCRGVISLRSVDGECGAEQFAQYLPTLEAQAINLRVKLGGGIEGQAEVFGPSLQPQIFGNHSLLETHAHVDLLLRETVGMLEQYVDSRRARPAPSGAKANTISVDPPGSS
jgi:hypothetical protein